MLSNSEELIGSSVTVFPVSPLDSVTATVRADVVLYLELIFTSLAFIYGVVIFGLPNG
jgi:hypothetical protein